MDTKQYDALLLKNQLCFPLYAASREVIKRYRSFLEALDITYTQYIMLMVIWEEETISVRDLGRKLYLDSGTLTPVLKHLEQKGLITRRRWDKDERVLMVSVTQEGLALRDKAASLPRDPDCALPLSEEEAGTLYGLLYKLLAAIETE